MSSPSVRSGAEPQPKSKRKNLGLSRRRGNPVYTHSTGNTSVHNVIKTSNCGISKYITGDCAEDFE